MAKSQRQINREQSIKIELLENRIDELVLVLNAFEPYIDLLNEQLEEKQNAQMMFEYRMACGRAASDAVLEAKRLPFA